MNEEALNLEIAALKHRLALLEGDPQDNTPVATLATLNGATPSPWEAQGYVNIIPEPRATVSISSLVGSEGFPRDPREFRHVLEAVALCYDVPAPQKDIPKPWVNLMRDVYAARTRGAAWSAALHAAGLETPADLTPHQHAARRELNGLWDDIPLMVEWVRRNTLSSVGHKELLLKLRQLLE